MMTLFYKIPTHLLPTGRQAFTKVISHPVLGFQIQSLIILLNFEKDS
jgi:hypothetical protein